MEFGLVLNGQSPSEEPAETLFEGLADQTRTARDAGFDLVTAGQHYLTDYNQLQPIPLLSRLTGECGSMTVGTGVLLLPLHHPVEIAEQISTLDAMAEQVIVGVGAGYRSAEFESFGIPKEERAGRLTEGIELLTRLWTDTNVTYDGEFYEIKDATINPRPNERPPMWVAANAQSAVERSAQLGDAWFVNPHATLAEITHHKRVYDELRERDVADTTVPLFREAFVAQTTEQAVETARDYLTAKYRRYVEWGQNEAMADSTDLQRPFERLAEDRFLLGTPAEVSAEIERYDEQIGVSHVIVRVQWPGLPHERACECIELMGDEIIPNV